MKRPLLCVMAIVMIASVVDLPGRAGAQFLFGTPIPGGPYYGTPGIPLTFTGFAASPYVVPIALQWAFGDGTVGFGAVVSHVYALPGIYAVTLTETDPSGFTGSASTTATIGATSATLQVDAGGPYSGTVGTALTLPSSVTVPAAGAAAALQYSWSFGDGSAGFGATAVHVYNSAGTFPVTVTVTGLGQSASSQTTAVIAGGLQVSAGVSTSAATGATVPFHASVVGATNPQFTWTFGDGASATGASATHVYQAPGNYTVTVSVVDLANGAQDSDSVTASIGAGMRVDANGPYSGIIGVPVQVAATVSGAVNPQYRWDFGDGSTGAGPSPTHVYEASGSFTITLQVTDQGTGQPAQDTASVSIQPGGPLVSYPSGWNLLVPRPARRSRAPAARSIPGSLATRRTRCSARRQALRPDTATGSIFRSRRRWR